jgi:dipeptidyl aminopeptidase/acylaminoacyl peptidase
MHGAYVTASAGGPDVVGVPTAPPAGHPPIPEDVYGSWAPAPAPDGTRIAFVSDRSGEPHVWFARPGQAQWTPLPATLHRVQTVSWSPDGAWLACVTAAPGASRHQVWLVRPDGTDLHVIAGAGEATAVIGGGPWHGWTADGHVMLTETAGLVSTALLVSPETGERVPVATGSLLTLLDVSQDRHRALLRYGPRGARRLEVVDVSSGDRIEAVTGTGPGTADIACLSPGGEVVYAVSDVGRPFAALVAVPADGSAEPAVVVSRPDTELHNVVLSADGRAAALVWNVLGGRSALSVLDLRSGEERAVGPLPRDVVDECRFVADGTRLAVTAESWADARGVWLLDLGQGSATPVSSTGSPRLRSSYGATTPAVDREDVTRPELRRLRSGDGTPLTGWLYAPAGPGPWPTMIHLHGGPEAQERPVYNSLFQSLVAADVAVFAPNVRGSSGFGRAFRTADDLDGRYGAIADVVACHQHLVESGVSDARRIGCMGRSYGGYLTLAALVWHPELFAVGVDVCGVVDFETFFAGTEPWIAAAATSKYGHPARDAALLRDLSPIHRIDRLAAPLLVVHGAEDTNVPVRQAEQLVAALTARGVKHRYLLFEGEGHELLATANRVTFVQETVAWVAEHLDVALQTARQA